MMWSPCPTVCQASTKTKHRSLGSLQVCTWALITLLLIKVNWRTPRRWKQSFWEKYLKHLRITTQRHLSLMPSQSMVVNKKMQTKARHRWMSQTRSRRFNRENWQLTLELSVIAHPQYLKPPPSTNPSSRTSIRSRNRTTTILNPWESRQKRRSWGRGTTPWKDTNHQALKERTKLSSMKTTTWLSGINSSNRCLPPARRPCPVWFQDSSPTPGRTQKNTTMSKKSMERRCWTLPLSALLTTSRTLARKWVPVRQVACQPPVVKRCSPRCEALTNASHSDTLN